MQQRPVGVGIVGAGFISAIYLENLTRRWSHLRVIGIADMAPDRAEARAAEFGILALPVEVLLAHPEIDIVLNLTIPAAHAEVSLRAVRAGKSVYTEKPLALDREEGQRLLMEAAQWGVLVGSAPDTFLGAGLQTARRLVDAGLIGEPVAFRARMITRGHERWHPDPAFYYQPGAGPMLDMGPYYVTALVALLGPVARVGGHARVTFPTRKISSEPRRGEEITVRTPTHIEAVLEMASGVTGSLMTTFDLWDPQHSAITIYGSEGSLRLPDPNTFGGPLRLLKAGEDAWTEVPLDQGYAGNARGLGVADLARALIERRESRASGALGYHVLEVMLATLDAAADRRHIEIGSFVERPAPLDPPAPGDDLDFRTTGYPGETLAP